MMLLRRFSIASAMSPGEDSKTLTGKRSGRVLDVTRRIPKRMAPWRPRPRSNEIEMKISARFTLAGALPLVFMLTASVAFASQPGPASPACTVEPVDFHGWKAERVANSWVMLTLVPQLGGRLMQVSFGNHDYLFVNPRYYGQYFPPSQEAAEHKWFNYGGDKDWPLPEGDQDEEHWAGSTSGVLDDGEYSFKVLSQGARCSVQLQGPPDPATGLQYSRQIGIDANLPRITFHAVMKNVTGHPIEWSIQSVSQYDTSDPQDRTRYNHRFWAFTPVNPQSAYLRSYHVDSGPADHRSYAVRDEKLFTLHWSYLEGEVWVDSPVGWIAVADGLSQYAMVERFAYQESAHYPGKASVIFYINGPQLGLDSDGMPKMLPNDDTDTPYYMEAELNSPLVRLAPGESYAFDTAWFPTRVGSSFQTVNDASIVSDPLTATRTADGVRLQGTFGVFYPGRLIARLYAHSVNVQSIPLTTVSPLELITLDKTINAPAAVTRVTVHLEDLQGTDRGAVGETVVNAEEKIQLK